MNWSRIIYLFGKDRNNVLLCFIGENKEVKIAAITRENDIL